MPARTTHPSDRAPRVDPPLLLDPEAERSLTEVGWAVVPYLSSEETEALRLGYSSLHPQEGYGFDTDFVYLDRDHKARVDDLLRPVIAPRLHRTFVDVQLFNVTFVTKWPGADSILPLHQDWSYVDEDHHRSASLWIALVDVSVELRNGPLALLPGSHRLPCEPRGANSLGWYRPWTRTITDALEPVSVRAGEAIVFDNRCLHASAPNESEVPRLAVASMVARAEVPLRYYHRAGSSWEVRRVTPGFFIEHSPLDLRLGRDLDPSVVEHVPVREFVPPLRELAALCGTEQTDLAPDPDHVEHRLGGLPLPAPRQARWPLQAPWRRRRVEPPIRRATGSLAATGLTEAAERAWDEARDLPRVPVGQVAEHWGTAEMVVLRDLREISGGPHIRSLLESLDRGGAAGPVAFAVLDPRFELPPQAQEGAAHDVLILPLVVPRPRGSVMFHAGTEMVTLHPDEALVLDPRWVHAAWNRGPIPTVLLLAQVRRGARWRSGR